MNLGSLMVAGVVGVFVSLLALRDGFAATLGATDRLAEAIVLRAGSNAELSSRLTRADVNVIGEAPGILRNAANRPLVSGEVVVVLNLPKLATGSAACAAFSATLKGEPRLKVDVQRTRDYYATQSKRLRTLIETLATAVAVIMGIGATFAALNTLYAVVTARARDCQKPCAHIEAPASASSRRHLRLISARSSSRLFRRPPLARIPGEDPPPPHRHAESPNGDYQPCHAPPPLQPTASSPTFMRPSWSLRCSWIFCRSSRCARSHAQCTSPCSTTAVAKC